MSLRMHSHGDFSATTASEDDREKLRKQSSNSIQESQTEQRKVASPERNCWWKYTTEKNI